MSERGPTGTDDNPGHEPHPAARRPPVPPAEIPFARRVVIAVGIALLMLGVAIFLHRSVYVLLLTFASILIAVMLRGMTNWLAGKTRLPDGAALALVVLGLVTSFAGLGVLLAPDIVVQFEQLADKLPQSVESAQGRLRQYSWGRKLLGEGGPGPAAAAAQRQGRQPAQGPAGGAAPPPTTQGTSGETVLSKAMDAPATVGKVVSYGRKVIEALFTFLLVIIVGIYLAAQPRFYVEGFLKLFPAGERPRLRDVLHEVGRTLLWWLIGQLIPMVAIGVFIGGGLWLIGVPMWLPLGILAALLNFIPNFGPIIAAIPAVLIALAEGPDKALWVVALTVAAQNLEGYVITPLVQRRAVEMPPALTILSQVLLGLLLGPLGLVLAAPLTAAALVVIKTLYVEDTLGTPVEHATPK